MGEFSSCSNSEVGMESCMVNCSLGAGRIMLDFLFLNYFSSPEKFIPGWNFHIFP